MNKIYLLAALAAFAYGTYTADEDADECGADMTEAEDGDYAYTFEYTQDAVTHDLTDDDTDNAATSVCYQDFIYDFVISDFEIDGETVADVDFEPVFYGYAADGADEDDVDFESVTLAAEEAYADAAADVLAEEEMTDPYDGGIYDIGTDVMTSSENHEEEEVGLPGVRMFSIWDATVDSVIVTGESNNALFQAASALTVAAAAGLLF